MDLANVVNDDNPATASDTAASLAYFASVPWTAKYLKSPKYNIVPTSSRSLKPTGEDAFFARTINTPSTVPYCLSLRGQDLESPQHGSSDNETTSQSSGPSISASPEIFDLVWLIHLAEPGLNGHPKTAHGGVLASILDEITGMCALIYRPDKSISMYTATLHTTYKAPVLLPSDAVCTAWLTRKEGRKYWIRAQILDDKGRLMTEGEALFVEVRTKQKL